MRNSSVLRHYYICAWKMTTLYELLVKEVDQSFLRFSNNDFYLKIIVDFSLFLSQPLINIKRMRIYKESKITRN